MVIEFDAAKDAINVRRHGVSLELIASLTNALTGPAKTVNGETRQFAIGVVDGITFFAVFVVRESAIRPISVRRAHRKERLLYEAQIGRRA